MVSSNSHRSSPECRGTNWTAGVSGNSHRSSLEYKGTNCTAGVSGSSRPGNSRGPPRDAYIAVPAPTNSNRARPLPNRPPESPARWETPSRITTWQIGSSESSITCRRGLAVAAVPGPIYTGRAYWSPGGSGGAIGSVDSMTTSPGASIGAAGGSTAAGVCVAGVPRRICQPPPKARYT